MTDPKDESVKEWLTAAWEDIQTAKVLGRGRRAILRTAVFHCQQAAEKAVKGFLTIHDCRFSKTHDIKALVVLAVSFEKEFESKKKAAARLTPYVAKCRYPGPEPGHFPMPTTEQFQRVLKDAEEIYSFVLTCLPEEVHPEPVARPRRKRGKKS